jgi:hypothetical protein
MTCQTGSESSSARSRARLQHGDTLRSPLAATTETPYHTASMPYRPLLFLAASTLFLLTPAVAAQPVPPATEREPLTVRQIMQDPRTWIGSWPSEVFWTLDGEHAYFSWNPRGEFPADSLFRVPARGGEIEQVEFEERRALAPRFDGWHVNRHVYTADFGRRVFERQGDLFIYDRPTRTLRQLTRDRATDQNPRFTLGEDRMLCSRLSPTTRRRLRRGSG